MSGEGFGEKLKGIAKEAAGRAAGDDELQREGEHQQAKGQKAEEADRLEQAAADKRREELDHEVEQRRHQD